MYLKVFLPHAHVKYLFSLRKSVCKTALFGRITQKKIKNDDANNSK